MNKMIIIMQAFKRLAFYIMAIQTIIDYNRIIWFVILDFF